MDQFDDHHAYNLLLKVFGNVPYVQHEHWGIRQDFTLDPLLASPEYINDDKLDVN